jgi:hypothetical protein
MSEDGLGALSPFAPLLAEAEKYRYIQLSFSVVQEAICKWAHSIAEANHDFGEGDHAGQLMAAEAYLIANKELRQSLQLPLECSSVEWHILHELEELRAGRKSRLFTPVDNLDRCRASKENRMDPAVVWAARSFAVAAGDALKRLHKWSHPQCLTRVALDIEQTSGRSIEDVLPGVSGEPMGGQNNERKPEKSTAALKIERAVSRLDDYRTKLNKAMVPGGADGPAYALYKGLLAERTGCCR